MANWVYDKIDGGSRQDFGRSSSNVSWRRQPAIHVLHTTEGTSWPGYSNGGSAPHFTINVYEKKTRQHFSLAAGARALRPGGVYANNMGTVQYEIIGRAKNTPYMTDEQVAYIAHVLNVVSEATGIKKVCSLTFKNSAGAYGTGSSTRMSTSAFHSYEGIMGHQHVPGNSHWDPGEFRIDELLKALGEDNYSPVDTVKTYKFGDRTLRKGMSGDDVKTLQSELNRLNNAGLKVDGEFGPLTDTAVKAYQSAIGIVRDGIVGPITTKKIKDGVKKKVVSVVVNWSITLRRGSSGASVSALQSALNTLINAGLKVDGQFGPLTEAAVKKYQKRVGIKVDGIVGPITRGKMKAGAK